MHNTDMKPKAFSLSLLYILLMCGCSNEEIAQPYQFKLQASELKDFGEDSTKVITDLAGYKGLFKDEASAVICDIDFKQKDLIVCRGTSSGNIVSITENINNHKGTWYISVVIEKGIAAVMEPWCVAYVVPKSADSTLVNTDIRYK